MKLIPSKYAGQCIALLDEHIVAVGKTAVEAYQKAKQAHPGKHIALMHVPRKKEVITFL